MTPPFYSTFVWLPEADSPTPPEIQHLPKFYPFFKHTLGAIDGTHIKWHPTANYNEVSRNHKGVLTPNCLVVCSFDLCFTYLLTGLEGSVADSTLFFQAHQSDFYIPEGRFYLGDAGFASSDALLVPY